MYRIGSLRYSDAQMYNISEYAWSNRDITVLGITISHDDLNTKNYDALPRKVDDILGSWQNRGLSLIGKVQVVNTLIASLFVYKMMVLPSIPIATVKSVDNKIRNFLWNGKKSKIAYNILQNKVEDGGLNLVNLKNKDSALKATWPQILYSEQDYAQMVYGIMRVGYLGHDIWRCSIEEKDIKDLKIKEPFWSDVVRAWSKWNPYYNRRIENQFIWYNSRIRIAGKIFFWQDVYVRGLKYVYQLFEGMKFKTEEAVWRQYGLTKLRYNSLKVSLPVDWKQYFTTTPRIAYFPIPPHNFDDAIHVF